MSPLAPFAFALALTALPARAGDGEPLPDDPIPGLELEIRGQAVWIDAPDVEGLGVGEFDLDDGSVLSRLDDEGGVEGFAGGAELLLRFDLPFTGRDTPWSVELGGSWARLEEGHHDFVRLGEDEILTPALVNGIPALGFLGVEQPMRQWFDGEVELWDVRLGLAHENEIVDFVWLETRLGVLGGLHQQDYEIAHDGLVFGDTVDDFFRASQRLSEKLDTWFIGPYLGLGLDTQITSRLSAFLDVELALLWHRTTLDAQQDLVALTFGLPGSGFGCTAALTDCAFDVEESDRTAGFGVRPRIRAGVDYDLGPFLIGLSGGVTYWSYAPQIVNPQVRPGLAGSERAHVSGDDLWVADLGLQVTVPFGRTRLQGGERAVALVNGLTLETTGHAVYVNAPDVEGLGIATLRTGPGGFGVTSVLNDEADVSTFGGGFDARAGFAAGEASGLSVELGGSYAKAEEDDNSPARFAPFAGIGGSEFASPVPVNGLVALGYVNLGSPLEQRVDGEVQVWDVRAGAALDVAVVDGVSGKARAGVVGGMLDQDYEIEHRPTRYGDVGGGPPPFYLGSHRLDERIESWFVGPYLGFGLEGALLDRLSVSLDFDLALLYHQADLDARQDVVGFLSGPGLACDGSSGTDCRFEFHERDKDDDFTARPRLRAGVDVDLGPFILGLSAGVTWWSHVPKIENPQVSDFAGSGFREARIGSGDMLTADAGLKITVPFGR